ncbi:MAG: hypothetical protein ABIL22_03575, partial [candidate division WOR-3 bacterium]
TIIKKNNMKPKYLRILEIIFIHKEKSTTIIQIINLIIPRIVFTMLFTTPRPLFPFSFLLLTLSKIYIE